MLKPYVLCGKLKAIASLGLFFLFFKAYWKMRLYTEIGTQELKTALKIKRVVIGFMQKERWKMEYMQRKQNVLQGYKAEKDGGRVWERYTWICLVLC